MASVALALSLGSGAAFGQQNDEVPPAADPSARTVAPHAQLFSPDANVTFTSTKDGAVLRREVNERWINICRAPCETSLDRSATYHVDGPGMSTSRDFVLPVGTSRIEARPGSLGLKVGGIVAVSVAGVVMLSGLWVYTLSSLCYTQERCDESQVASQRATGAVVMGLGLAGVVAGVAMIVQGRTTVSTALALSTQSFTFLSDRRERRSAVDDRPTRRTKPVQKPLARARPGRPP